jgi:hypothetical protein
MNAYRHELKYLINPLDAATLETRLRAVLAPDHHAAAGRYTVRSLYFDDPYSRVLAEKLAGTDHRFKYRLRIYNGSDAVIRLERKERAGGLGRKMTVTLDRNQAEYLLGGKTEILLSLGDPLAVMFYGEIKSGLLRPRRIVEYDRTAYTHPAGNVRVTLDRGLRTASGGADFFAPVLMPAMSASDVMEVKYDRFLPSHIAHLVLLDNHASCANSKYLNCSADGGLY